MFCASTMVIWLLLLNDNRKQTHAHTHTHYIERFGDYNNGTAHTANALAIRGPHYVSTTIRLCKLNEMSQGKRRYGVASPPASRSKTRSQPASKIAMLAINAGKKQQQQYTQLPCFCLHIVSPSIHRVAFCLLCPACLPFLRTVVHNKTAVEQEETHQHRIYYRIFIYISTTVHIIQQQQQ